MPAKWTHKVKTRWHSDPGLFKQSAKVIAKTVADASKDLRQAMNRVQYYETRAGANLTPANRKNIETAKRELRKYFGANLAASPQHHPSAAAKPKARKTPKARKAPKPAKPSVAKPKARRLPETKASLRELPIPKPGAAYWFAWSTDPKHWRKGRSPYRYRIGSVQRFLGRSLMPTLGEGYFYLYAVTIRGKTAHLAQRAIPLHVHAYR